MSALTVDTDVIARLGSTCAVVHGVIVDHQRAMGWCRCFWREIADLTGLSPRQVGYALDRLESAGLVEALWNPTARAPRALAHRTTERTLP